MPSSSKDNGVGTMISVLDVLSWPELIPRFLMFTTLQIVFLVALSSASPSLLLSIVSKLPACAASLTSVRRDVPIICVDVIAIDIVFSIVLQRLLTRL
jgi:hypothetical protein